MFEHLLIAPSSDMASAILPTIPPAAVFPLICPELLQSNMVASLPTCPTIPPQPVPVDLILA